MRIAAGIVVFAAMLTGMAHAALPTSLDEFQAQIAQKASDPKAAVKLWFDAVYVYIGGNRALGEQLITEMCRDKDWKTAPTYSYFVTALNDKPYIFASYAKGTSPDTKYQMDPNSYELVFEGQVNMKPFADKAEGDYCKLFVRSSGADSARPITLIRNNKGEYKFYEFSSIFVGTRPPAQEEVLDESVPESKEPPGAVRHWLIGILKYLGGDKEAGLKQMNAVMKEKVAENNLRYAFHDALSAEKAYIWRSYAKGAAPDNGYKVDDVTAIQIETYFQPGEAPTATSKQIRMFVKSSGADSARPIRLERDSRGEWRVIEYSSLCVGVRAPKTGNEGNF
jgi:Domain of unknown function (DUF6935)